MSEPQPPAGPIAVRVSDADRDAVAGELAQNMTEGRLTLDELSQRLDLVYAAKTTSDLEAVTRDLPAAPQPSTRSATRWVVSILGGSRRAGRWRAGERVRVVSVLGGSEIDLSHAVVTTAEIRLGCFAFLGGIDITVPRGVEVEMTGLSLIGGRNVDVGEEPAHHGTPLVRVRAFSILGGIDIHNPPKKRL